MAGQQMYYVTYVNPVGGSAAPPPPGVHVANPLFTWPGTSSGCPPPPPYSGGAQNPNPPAPPYAVPGVDYEGDGVSRQNKHRGDEQHPTVVQGESRKWKWAMFVAGNLISIAVVVSEIVELNVCFDENLDDDDDTPEENAESTYSRMMVLLVLGLWIDVFSAITLSVIYRSPLDIKSAHKIPPGDMRHCGATCMINFLGPFSWFLVYLFGGLISASFGKHSPCGGGQGGSGMEQYLVISGGLMLLTSFAMLLISVIMLLAACCSTSTHEAQRRGTYPPPRGCCARLRDRLHRAVLSKGPIFDIGWQLQGVLLSYRVGSFSLSTAFLVAASGVVGEVLCAFGSLAPEAVQDLLGPI